MYKNQINEWQQIEKHATLVHRIGHHLLARLPPDVMLDDLLQAGMIGLLEAIKNYDGTKGASFETYAGIRIRGSMLDEVRRGDWVPRSVHRNAREIAKSIRDIENKTGRDARDTEVAQALGVTMLEYHKMLQDAQAGYILAFDDMSADENSNYTPGIAEKDSEPVQRIENYDFRDKLADAIANLPEREKLILALYYDEELNLKEIGEILGVSESRVSQINSQAVLRLQSRLKDWKD
jgi:RNA polymerase sigma factor FliA